MQIDYATTKKTRHLPTATYYNYFINTSLKIQTNTFSMQIQSRHQTDDPNAIPVPGMPLLGILSASAIPLLPSAS